MTLLDQTPAFSIPCSACGAPAADICFLPQGKYGPSIAQRGFLGEVIAMVVGTRCATPELFAEIADLARSDLRSLRAMDRDLFGFICLHCGVAYCRDCWRDVHVTFDDGYYDETRGICPQGHEQMLQD